LARALRWRYAPIEAPVSESLLRYERFAPHVLYGCVTPLRLLAEEVRAHQRSLSRPRMVITTAELLDAATRELIQRVFGCEVYDFYGLSETGLVAWECPAHNGCHLAEDTFIVEEVPAREPDAQRLILTTLDSLAMPFLRYDTGDLGIVDRRERCACGRSFALLRRIDGRLADCVRLPDGRVISPYAITTRLETIPGIRRYHVVQEDLVTVVVSVDAGDTRDSSVADAIVGRLGALLGDAVSVIVHEAPRIEPPPGRKFRVVESNIQ